MDPSTQGNAFASMQCALLCLHSLVHMKECSLCLMQGMEMETLVAKHSVVAW